MRVLIRSGKEHKALHLLLLIALGIACYRGFKLPSLWSVNYYLPSFFDGFYRRGLAGTMLYVFGELRFNYYFIIAIQFTVTATLLCVIFRYVFRADVTLKIVTILYFLAPTGGYLFNEVGYIDQLLYLLLFVLLVSPNKMLNAFLLVLSLFIHEEALFTIFPIYIAYLIINKTDIKYVLSTVAVVILSFVLLFVGFRTVPQENIDKLTQKISVTANYKVHPDYYTIFDHEFVNELATSGVYYYNEQLFFSYFLIFILALFIASLFVQKEHDFYENALYFFSVLFACISPLLLGFAGFDSSRWLFMSFSSSLIMFGLYQDRIQTAHVYSIVFILVLFLVFGRVWYFSGNHEPRSVNISLQGIASWKQDLMGFVSKIHIL